MNKLRYFFLLFLFLPLILQAQDSISVKKELYPPAIKFSPLSLLDPLKSVQFALEHQLKPKMSLQHELGYIFSYQEPFEFQEDSYAQTRGIRIRNEFRRYFYPYGAGLEGFYFAPEFLYNFMRFSKSASVGRSCTDDWTCQYYEYMNYRVQKQVFAMHIKFGYQELIFNRLIFDIYAGLGGRHVKELNVHPPNGLQPNDRFDFDGEKYISTWPSVSFGFKLGYLLYRKQQSHMINDYPDGDYPYYIEQ